MVFQKYFSIRKIEIYKWKVNEPINSVNRLFIFWQLNATILSIPQTKNSWNSEKRHTHTHTHKKAPNFGFAGIYWGNG